MSLPDNQAVKSIVSGIRSRLHEWDDTQYSIAIQTSKREWHICENMSFYSALAVARGTLSQALTDIHKNTLNQTSVTQKWVRMATEAHNSIESLVDEIDRVVGKHRDAEKGSTPDT